MIFYAIWYLILTGLLISCLITGDTKAALLFAFVIAQNVMADVRG